MAEDKKGFLLYADQLGAIKKLVLKDRSDGTNNAGELFLHILEYVNDNEPEPINFIVDVSFEPIKNNLKRDLKKYEGIKEIKSDNGKLGNLKRWNTDLYDMVVAGKLKLEDAIIIAQSRKASPSDNFIANVAVIDNVNVSDTVKDKDIKKNIYKSFAHLSISIEDHKKLQVDYTDQQINGVLESIENYKKNTNYKSLYLTAKKWLEKEYPKIRDKPKRNVMPLLI